MNWDAIGAMGEVIGAAGVIGSLLYLALQIRHSSKTSQDAAYRDAFTAVSNKLSAMSEPANREIILKGLTGFGGLPGPDKYAFDNQLMGLFTLLESSIISNDAELILDESLENWSFVLRTRYLPYAGFIEWWESAEGTYLPQTREWVKRQIQRADSESDFWGIK